MTTTRKVLITLPHLSLPGGVAALYNVLKLDRAEGVAYFILQGRHHRRLSGMRLIELLFLLMRFVCRVPLMDCVVVNPSMNRRSYLRDGMLACICKLLGKDLVVFWHGWEQPFFEQISRKRSYGFLYRYGFRHARLTIVLASRFEQLLRGLGHSEQVVVETNSALPPKRKSSTCCNNPASSDTPEQNILFMSRIVREKGVFIALDAFRLLPESLNCRLIIAGTGPDLEEARTYCRSNGISGVEFHGHVVGEDKDRLLRDCALCLFPTYYGEGMPLTVIEALAYGKPVVTRPEGGIPDWLTNGEDAVIIGTRQAEDFAHVIAELLENPRLAKRMGTRAEMLFNSKFHPDEMRQRMLGYFSMLPDLKPVEEISNNSTQDQARRAAKCI